MKLRCHIERSDYLCAQYLHLRPRPLFMWLGILLVCLFILVGLRQIFIPPADGITTRPFVIFGVLIYFALAFGVWLPYRAMKIYGQQRTLQEPYETELTEVEFASTSSLGSARIKWTDFHKYKVGKKMILVYQSDAIFHMFPKRWFSDEDYQKLLQILRNALGKPKP